VSERNHPEAIRCEEFEFLAVLYACGEVDEAARAAVETHTAECMACSAILQREIRMHLAITSVEPPAESLDRSSLLLAQCRSELSRALDEQEVLVGEENAQPRSLGWRIVSPTQWWMGLRHALVYHPVASMAVLVLASFTAGVAGQHWRSPLAVTSRPVVTVSAAPKVTEQQLQNAGSANVSWATPAGSRVPTVQVQLMSQTPMNIVGSADDEDVRRALTFVLGNGQRFDSDARLDSLEVLRTLSGETDVRRALCSAARNDDNPGVRIKALEALQGFAQDSQVQDTLLAALKNDSNSGVRVQAMNLLLDTLQANASDAKTLAVLRDRMHNDSNNYIRLQSAAALRQFGSGELP
jgi:hypothetical protein